MYVLSVEKHLAILGPLSVIHELTPAKSRMYATSVVAGTLNLAN